MAENNYIHGVAPEEQDRLRLLNKLTNASFFDFVQIQSGEQVLELGSGLGIVANALAAKDPTITVFGIEYAAEQIAGCDQSAANVEFMEGDAHNLPFAAEAFDVVYGRYVLEHLQDPLGALQETYRVLKPGGRVYFQENTQSLIRFYPECPAFDLVWKQFVVLQSLLGGDGDIGLKLYSLLKKAGFQDCRLSFAEEIHYREKGTFIDWVDNIVGNVVGGRQRLIEFDLVTEDQIENALQELEDLKKDELGSAYFYWNRIQGRRKTDQT